MPNPYHDSRGRFASKGTASKGSGAAQRLHGGAERAPNFSVTKSKKTGRTVVGEINPSTGRNYTPPPKKKSQNNGGLAMWWLTYRGR